MKIQINLINLALLFIVFATVCQAQNAKVGNTNIVASVSNLGSAEAGLQIYCPPGRLGIKPQVSVNYNSSAGISFMGQGWSLNATSAIVRSGSNFHLDGTQAAINFSSTDRLMLDGERLLLISGNYLQASSTYRTEHDKFVLVSFDGTSFIVDTKDGGRLFYGYTSDSRHNPYQSTEVVGWYLKRSYDINGNYVEYEFNNTNGQIILEQINYTGFDCTFWGTKQCGGNADAPYNSVVFTYANANYNQLQFLHGKAVNQNKLLTKIETFAQTAKVRSYDFSYTQNDIAAYLESILEKNGNNEALPTVDITWQDDGTSPQTSNKNFYMSTNELKLTGDFDGDGKKDLLTIDGVLNPAYNQLLGTTNTVKIYKGGGFSQLILKRNLPYNNISAIMIGDVDADGDDDIVFQVVDVIDQTNDFQSGCPDPFIRFYLNSITFKYHLLQSNYNNGVYDHAIFLNHFPSRLAQNGQSILHLSSIDQYFKMLLVAPMMGDVDGDGLIDLIERKLQGDRYAITYCSNSVVLTGVIPAKSSDMYVYLSTRRNLPNVIDRYVHRGNTPEIDFIPMDFNGNGKLDFMQLIKWNNTAEILEYNNTNWAFVPIYGSPPTGFPHAQYHKYLQFGDFNGDSKTDLLYFANAWYVAYSNGVGFEEHNATYLWFGHTFSEDYSGYNTTAGEFNLHVGDFNGDGKSDIIERHTASSTNVVYIYYSKGFGFKKEYIGENPVMGNNGYYHSPYTLLGDFDGDGKTDIWLFEDQALPSQYEPYPVQESVLLKFPTKNFKVKQIIPSDVSYYDFTYSPLTQTTKYTKESTLKPFSMARKISAPIFVVTAFKQSTIGFNDEVLNYSYKNLLYHTHGRGLMGFTTIAIVNNDNTNKKRTTISTYKQNVELTYKLDVSTVEVFNNCTNVDNPFTTAQTIIAKSIYTHAQLYTSSNPKTVFPYCSYSTEMDFLKGVVKSTCYSYDKNGNLIHTVSDYAKEGAQTPEFIQTTSNLFAQHGTWLPASVTITRTTQLRKSSGVAFEVQKEFAYNNKGQLTSTENYKANMQYYYKELFGYDVYGNIVYKALDSANNTTGNVFRKTLYDYGNGKFMITSTNALNHVTQFEYEPMYGNLLVSTGSDGTVISNDYDDWGTLLQKNMPGGNYVNTLTEYTSSPVPGEAYYKTTTTDNLGGHGVVFYNARNQKIREETLGFKNKTHVKIWQYTAKGLLAKESLPFDAQYPNNIRYNFFEYDEFNRLKWVKYKNSLQTIHYTYNKTITTEDYGNGRTKVTELNATGDIIKVTDNGGMVEYLYHSHSKPVQIISPGQSTTIVYNIQLNKIELSDPNAGKTEYDYNAFGELHAQQDAKGYLLKFNYDDLGRVVHKTGPQRDYYYTYYNTPNNATNNKIQTEELKLNGVVKHTKNYSYNTHGLLAEVEEQQHAPVSTSTTTTYEYDNNLRLEFVHYPNISLKYVYDGANNLEQITDAQNNMLWQKNSTHANGAMQSYAYGNGYTTDLSFNADDLLTGITSNKSGQPNAMDYTYDFDLLTGNLNHRINNTISKRETFTYDNLDRLTTIIQSSNTAPYTPLQTTGYAYAGNGSITNINPDVVAQSLQYTSAKPQAVTKHNSPTYQTPQFVPLASVDVQNLTYNQVNMLGSIDQEVNFVPYLYTFNYGINDARIFAEEKHGGVSVYTKQYFGSANMEIENGVEYTYLYAEGQPFALHKKDGGIVEMFYLHVDYQMSIMAITDESGVLRESRSYDAWGRPRDPSTWAYQLTPFGAVSFTSRGYTFHEHLIQYSLINMNARMYDPVLGRVLSPDNFVQAPENTQSFNRYSYCWNNPLKYIDPSGQIIAFTDFGYEFWKAASPVAIKININSSSQGFSLGADASVGVPQVMPIHFRAQAGASYHFGNDYNGYKGWEGRYGFEAGVTVSGIIGVKTGMTYYDFKGSKFDQRTNQITIGNAFINFKYENDFMFGLPADGGDRYRTAAGRLSIGHFNVGFNLYTGDPGLDGDDRKTAIVNGQLTYVNNANGDDPNEYRLGVAYVGFAGFRVGRNSETIRHTIQNKFAHDTAYGWTSGGEKLPHFAIDNTHKSRWYWNFGTGTGNSLW